MNNVTRKKQSRHNNNNDGGGGLIDWITQYESLVIFGGLGCLIVITIVLTGMFEAGPIVRDNVLYNAIGAICMAIGFIYLIFQFMGDTVIILGNTIDMGMVIYIAIVLFVMFVLGN
jgi:hypothetical protein